MTEKSLKERVMEVLDLVRPGLQADGGDVELIEVKDDGKVYVQLKGACAGCPMSQLTLKMGIEQNLKKAIPEVTEVLSI